MLPSGRGELANVEEASKTLKDSVQCTDPSEKSSDSCEISIDFLKEIRGFSALLCAITSRIISEIVLKLRICKWQREFVGKMELGALGCSG